MKNTIKTGLASFGMSGRIFHAPFLVMQNGFEVVKILERTKKLSEKIIPAAQIVRKYDDLLNDPEIELVVVNTPNQFHFSMTRQALEAGKHVIVEKPFTTTSQEADELITLAGKKNLVLAVYHNRRFDTEFQTVKSIIEKKLLGEVKLFESKIYRWKPDLGNKRWKVEPVPGSGLLYDLGSHLIDQVLSLFGKPDSIFADLGNLRQNALVDDYFLLILDYGQKKAIIKSFLLSASGDERFLISGTKGTYVKNGPDLQEAFIDAGIMPETPEWKGIFENQAGKIITDEKEYAPEPVCADYSGFFINIFHAIREGAKLVVQPYQARDVIRTIEIARKSYLEKRYVDYVP